MSFPTPVIDPAGREYPSLTKAAKAHNIDRKTLQKRLDDPASGWRYRDGEPPEQPPRPPPSTRRVIGPHGRIYASAEAAAKSQRRPVQTIRHWCQHGKRGWRYEDDPPAAEDEGAGLALHQGLYADNVAWWHPRERVVYLRGGG